MKKEKISDAVIRRLPRYYRYLDELHAKGIVRISSGSLGKRMGVTASQIRQDLSCFGEFGQQGYGYNIMELRAEIGHILGVDDKRRLIVAAPDAASAIVAAADKLGERWTAYSFYAYCRVSEVRPTQKAAGR